MTDLIKAMQAIGEANRSSGGAQKGGKRYTMVQDRVLEWRKIFGLQHGITTTILRDDGSIVQVQATIADEAGRVLGRGLAAEIRGGFRDLRNERGGPRTGCTWTAWWRVR